MLLTRGFKLSLAVRPMQIIPENIPICPMFFLRTNQTQSQHSNGVKKGWVNEEGAGRDRRGWDVKEGCQEGLGLRRE